jgi:predicted MFS family arabinose efflux permease
VRIEYLANPIYGINADNAQIGLILGTIPFVARLVATRIWGYLFERLNFIQVRLLLNMFFFISILLFFSSSEPVILIFSTALLGIAFGGGGILWTLWVTKIAPPEKVSAYMSVHMTFTGLRAALAPFLGYYLLVEWNPLIVGWVGALLVGLSTIAFIPMRGAVEKRSSL